MDRLRVMTWTVTTTGGAGSASGNADSPSPITGEVLAVYVDYHASAPATTDLTLKTKGDTPPSYNIIVISNSATDAYKAPRSGAVDAANAAITNSFVPFAVSDKLNCALAQSDALTDAVRVTVLYRDIS